MQSKKGVINIFVFCHNLKIKMFDWNKMFVLSIFLSIIFEHLYRFIEGDITPVDCSESLIVHTKEIS